MLLYKVFQLSIQPAANQLSVGSEVKGVCPFHTKHSVHSTLQAALIILQCQVKHRSLPYLIPPKGPSRTDMIGNLCHQKRLANFGRSGKDVCSCIEQVFNYCGLTLEHSLHQLVQGHSMEIGGVLHALNLTVELLKIIFCGIVFRIKIWYSNIVLLRD